jgi:hypothetical protein
MSLVRSSKSLPPELATASAWKARLRDEPARVVLADAYECNLWHLNADGVPVVTDHPIHETTIESFLHCSAYAYDEAIVEVLRRRGHDPYERLMEDAQTAGVPERGLQALSACLHRIEGARMSSFASAGA